MFLVSESELGEVYEPSEFPLEFAHVSNCVFFLSI